MFKGAIIVPTVNKLVYHLESHKSIPRVDALYITFEQDKMSMVCQDMSKSILSASEFSYDNFDSYEIVGEPMQCKVDIENFYKVVKTLSQFEQFTLKFKEETGKITLKTEGAENQTIKLTINTYNISEIPPPLRFGTELLGTVTFSDPAVVKKLFSDICLTKDDQTPIEIIMKNDRNEFFAMQRHDFDTGLQAYTKVEYQNRCSFNVLQDSKGTYSLRMLKNINFYRDADQVEICIDPDLNLIVNVQVDPNSTLRFCINPREES